MRRREPTPNGPPHPTAEGPVRGLPPGLERKILEELVYEKVRLTLNICELLDFEADLSTSIDRALSDAADTPDERSELALFLLERAWSRLSDDVLTGLAAQESAGSHWPDPPRRPPPQADDERRPVDAE